MENLFNKITELVKKYDTVILMSHQNPDLDAIGSMFGLYEILNALGVKTYLYLEKNNNYDNSVKEVMKLNSDYCYINSDNDQNLLSKRPLLIIVDVHQDTRIENPNILNKDIDIVVLDHHIKSSNYIKNTILFYIDSNLSSMVELISEYSKYLNIHLTSNTATIMLGGLEIDTNMYNLKTTEKTYEIAAYLTSLGADNILKQKLLKESKDDYLRKADFIKRSYAINKMAICVLNTGEFKSSELAEVADELLKFEEIEASFSIGKLDKSNIGISARSIGTIDVCEIMQHFNGGGHTNNAAAQIVSTNLKKVENELKKRLENIK